MGKVPALGELVARDGDYEIVLTNGIVIDIQTASFRLVRGYTVIAALGDEIAYWPSDELSANPDSGILAALRPAMATVPGARFALLLEPVHTQRRALERLRSPARQG